MNWDKEEVQKRILRNGKPLDLKFFTWDPKTKTFSSLVNGLVIDFTLIDGCTFNLADYCLVKMGDFCNVKSGHGCVFEAGCSCNFETRYSCTFITSYSCDFKVGNLCVVVRRDMDSYEVIEPKAGQKIRLKYDDFKGFDVLNESNEKVKE